MNTNAFGAPSPPAPVNIAGGTADAVATLDAAGRAKANRRAEVVAALGQGLGALPYGARRAALAHLGPRLMPLGLTPAAVANFDPTDGNLAALQEEVAELRGRLQAP